MKQRQLTSFASREGRTSAFARPGAADMNPRWVRGRLAACGLLALLSSCAHVPADIAPLRERELATVQSLQQSYAVLVDAYVDLRVSAFENFYFTTYGPSYLKNWKNVFSRQSGRNYDESRDFAVLYGDLVAEYSELVAPIEALRGELKTAIADEFANVIESHRVVDAWIRSAADVQGADRGAINTLLASLAPRLSLDGVEQRIALARQKVQARLKTLDAL